MRARWATAQAHCVAALILFCVAALPSGAAQAQLRRPVGLEVEGIFGNDLVHPRNHATVRIDAENRTGRAMSGELEIRVRDYTGGPAVYTTRFDLPPRAVRVHRMTVYVGENGATIDASYRAQGRRQGQVSTSFGYGSERGVVVLADPPRLRGALHNLEVEVLDTSYPGAGMRNTTVPAGAVSFDPTTSDPLLPDRAVGWTSVTLFAVSGPMLARISEPDRAALRDWLRAGGRMLVFPRTDADLRDPFLVSLVGPLERTTHHASATHRRLTPHAAQGSGFSGGPRFRQEGFGGSAPVGFGRVYVATYDGAAPAYVEATETREAIRSILSHRRHRGVDSPIFRYGSGEQHSQNSYGPLDFGKLRASLDPNESFRPALGLVAIVLLLYVFVVGPVNFSWVGKRNRPILALLTTPLAAMICLAVMLGVGYVGKGTQMRYRRVQLTELLEGDREGPTRAYEGLFLTRPATFDLAMPERGSLRTLLDTGGSAPPPVDQSGAAPVLEDVRGALWETVFLEREDITDVGGPITFERARDRLTAVVNGTGRALVGALVVDATGSVYPIGDVPAGGRASIPEIGAFALDLNNTYYGPGDDRLRRLGRALRLDEDYDDAVAGLVEAMGGTVASPPMPILIARFEAPPDERVAGLFSQEFDLRFVRVVPFIMGSAVNAAMPVNPGDYDRYVEDPPMPEPAPMLAPDPLDEPTVDAAPEAQVTP